MQSELERQLNEVRTKYPLVGQHIEYLERRATIDPVTCLYSRLMFDEELPIRLSETSRRGGTLSLLILDLDEFKKYNDTYGHLAGDKLLKDSGEKIRENLRKMDMAFRYGGDEFAALISHYMKGNITGSRMTSAKKVAERILERFQKKEMPLTVSIGIATSYGNSTAKDFIECADKALYCAKEIRNTIYQYPEILP